ncbi:MAG TPA: hypothetical protein VG366_02100 [Solirubrobacteraceae bacterium]|jgi:hypothetical protein|nr:hypothetical protein [Solirubrobacteraceae bacterium]
MATRTIVTSQPDVACDVCERRLLRGEHADIFLAAGRRRTVCELCAPRAAHEGWMRERDSHSLSLPPLRARRGRSFLERLRQAARPADADEPVIAAEPGAPAAPAGAGGSEDQPYDFLDGYGSAGAAPVPALPRAEPADGDPGAAGESRPSSHAERALEVFNASEFPRRIAGVARSLGAPEVNVRSAEHLASVVRIVVAWELSWYRYEVDLSEEPVQARVLAQGTELSELTREERAANAIVADTGALSLAA